MVWIQARGIVAGGVALQGFRDRGGASQDVFGREFYWKAAGSPKTILTFPGTPPPSPLPLPFPVPDYRMSKVNVDMNLLYPNATQPISMEFMAMSSGTTSRS